MNSLFCIGKNTYICLNKQNEKQIIMTSSAITSTLNKIKNDTDNCSLGFKRLIHLPKRVRLSFTLSANLKNDWDSVKANKEQKEFLESLTEKEFNNWLLMA